MHYNSRDWASDSLITTFEIMCGEDMLAEASEKSPDGEDSNNFSSECENNNQSSFAGSA